MLDNNSTKVAFFCNMWIVFCKHLIAIFSELIYFRFFRERLKKPQWLLRGWKNCWKHVNLQLVTTLVFFFHGYSFFVISFVSHLLYFLEALDNIHMMSGASKLWTALVNVFYADVPSLSSHKQWTWKWNKWPGSCFLHPHE